VEPLPPSVGEHGDRNVNSFGIDAVRGVEWRQLADRAVDEVGLEAVWVVEEREVGLHRRGGLRRKIVLVERAEDRLGPDDKNLGVVGHPAGGAQQVGQLADGSPHRPGSGQHRAPLGVVEHTGERAAGAQVSCVLSGLEQGGEHRLHASIDAGAPLAQMSGGAPVDAMPALPGVDVRARHAEHLLRVVDQPARHRDVQEPRCGVLPGRGGQHLFHGSPWNPSVSSHPHDREPAGVAEVDDVLP
jgi:hypothetical protein